MILDIVNYYVYFRTLNNVLKFELCTDWHDICFKFEINDKLLHLMNNYV